MYLTLLHLPPRTLPHLPHTFLTPPFHVFPTHLTLILPSSHASLTEAVLGEDEDGTLTPLPMPSTSSDEKLYVFPVSNSVLDLMVMLTRAARFTGTTLEVLSPKMRLGVSRVEREKVPCGMEGGWGGCGM